MLETEIELLEVSVGVFTNDREKSNEQIGTVWTRISNELNVNTGGYQ